MSRNFRCIRGNLLSIYYHILGNRPRQSIRNRQARLLVDQEEIDLALIYRNEYYRRLRIVRRQREQRRRRREEERRRRDMWFLGEGKYNR